MSTLEVARAAGTLLVLTLAAGCAGTPDRAVAETPRWMKDYVTGSRIARATTARGDVATAESVVETSSGNLRNLPSVYIRITR